MTIQLCAEDAYASVQGVNGQNGVCSHHTRAFPTLLVHYSGSGVFFYSFCILLSVCKRAGGLGTAVTLHVLGVLGEFEPFFPAAGRESACGAALSCMGVTGCYRLDPEAQSQDTISFCPFTF